MGPGDISLCAPLRWPGSRNATANPSAPLLLYACCAQEVAQEVMDTKQLGQRGELYFVAQVVALALVAFPPAFL